MSSAKPGPRNILTVIAAPHWGGLQVVVERTTPYFEEAGYRRFVAGPQSAKSKMRLEKVGCKVLDITLGRPRKALNPIENIRYIRRFWDETQKLKRVIHSERIDVVEVAGLLNFQPALAALQTKTPLVWQLHSTLAPAFIRMSVGALASRCANVMMTSGAAMIDQHGGLSRRRAEIIPFCAPLDLRLFQPNFRMRRCIRRKLGFDEADVVVGTLGNRSWQKRHEWIVGIADRMRNTGLRFALVGSPVETNDNYYRSKVVNAIAEYGLGDRVKVIDQSDPAEDVMNAFDIFLLPSVAEGASLVTAEAMATGLPIVASEVGSLPDIVLPGENGYLCDVNSIDAFCRALSLLQGSDLRTSMGAASRRIAEATLGARRCAEAHFRAYRAALGPVAA